MKNIFGEQVSKPMEVIRVVSWMIRDITMDPKTTDTLIDSKTEAWNQSALMASTREEAYEIYDELVSICRDHMLDNVKELAIAPKRKIRAIALHRAYFACTLMESKAHVESVLEEQA